MKCAILLGTLLSGFLAAAGCKTPTRMDPYTSDGLRATPPTAPVDYSRELGPGELALRQILPDAYPDFSRGFYERAGLDQALDHSIQYLHKPSSQRYYPYGEISHARALASLVAFKGVLDEARTPEQLDALVRQRFDVYQSVGCDRRGTVYFTGYYTPIFEGRRQPDARFKYPLYRLPADLVKGADGQTLGRRTPEGKLWPYYTRREIEEDRLLAGGEIAWLSDPFEAYVVSVQGSAKLRLADGRLWDLGYAGNNGRDYSSVGWRMVTDGVIRRDELSLQGLIDYFRAHPEDVLRFCWLNERYVFFQETEGGPFGSIGTPVTDYRTIATDKAVFPRGCLAYVDTRLQRVIDGQPRNAPFAAFALDQDAGGAIRAAGRCDVYMGVGEQAGAVAGRTGAEGGLYYLFVKPDFE